MTTLATRRARHNTPLAERDAVPLTDLVRPADLANEYPGLFTAPGLRWLIRQRHRNGLANAGAVVLVGNRALLVRSRFEKWLGSQLPD